MPSLVFRDAEKARDSICIEDQKKIRGLYKEWAEEVGERAKYFENKTTASSYWQQQQMLELQRQMKAQSEEIHKQIESGAKQSMYTVADSVVGANAAYLKALGFPQDGLNAAMTSIPPNVVNNIVTGQIYESGWSLSKAIWGDNEKTLADIYEIVAKGRAMNMSAYDVSKLLEGYVNPAKAKMWNLKMPDGVWIYKKSVDYNAQRLVRTLNQHAYQQSVIQVAKDNPFIGDIIWHANGSRACPLCIERDGNHYKPQDVPMDHPNGMCTMEPETDMDKTIDQLADWINSPDGTYPEIDEFAKQFGYVPGVSNLDATQKKWLEAAGYTNGQMPKDFTEFAHKLSFEQQSELLKEAGGSWGDAHPYQKMEQYFNANIAKPGGIDSVKVEVGKKAGIESLGTSSGKTFNYWYTKLSPEQKELAKQLKEESGLTWQKFYEQNIYSGPAKTLASSPDAISSIDDINKLLASGDKGFDKVEKLFAKNGIDVYSFLDDENKLDKEFLQSMYPDYEAKLFGSQAAQPAPVPEAPTAAVDNTPLPTKSIGNMSMDDIMEMAQKQTVESMLELEERAFNKMAASERSGIRTYSGEAYTRMNNYLRLRASGKSHDDAVKESRITEKQLKAIENAQKGLEKSSLEKDLILRRGTDIGDLAGLLPGNFKDNFNMLKSMSVEELNQRYSGVVGEYAGFTSTSGIWDRGFRGNVEVVFQAPQGTQASSIMKISKYGTAEGETLLNAGTRVRVNRIEESDGHMGSRIRIFMDILLKK